MKKLLREIKVRRTLKKIKVVPFSPLCFLAKLWRKVCHGATHGMREKHLLSHYRKRCIFLQGFPVPFSLALDKCSSG